MIIRFRKHEEREAHASDAHAVDAHAIDEREWALQERALAEERAARSGEGSPEPGRDPAIAAYRQVARALRQPLPDLLPADFAAQVAARAAADTAAARDGRMEQWLMRALVAVFGLSATAVVALYGGQWLPPILRTLQLDSTTALNWALALGACVAVSALMEPLRRRMTVR